MQTAELPNPVVKDGDLGDSDALDQSFLDAAAKADRGEDFALPIAQEPDTRETGATEDKLTPSNTDTDPEKQKATTDERPRDELGRFTKTKDGVDIPESERSTAEPLQVEPKDGDPKPAETPYAKAQRERERQQNLLANFERDKAAFRQEQEAFARQVAQLQAQQQQGQRPQQQTSGQYRAQDFAQFAMDCTEKATRAKEDGDYDEAVKQSELAAQASARALQLHEQEVSTMQQHESASAQQAWAEDMQRVIAADPELQKADSPITKEVTKLLGEYAGLVEHIPPVRLASGQVVSGFGIAKRVAELQLEAASVPVLRTENQKLKTENEALNRRLGLNGGGPVSQSGQRTIDSMSEEEADRFLMENARHLDQMASR